MRPIRVLIKRVQCGLDITSEEIKALEVWIKKRKKENNAFFAWATIAIFFVVMVGLILHYLG
jgi:hypothetical protein